MDLDPNDLSSLLPSVTAQLRGALSNLYLAASRLAPTAQRENDPELDSKAALVDQSYYQLLRLVHNLADVGKLDSNEPLPLQNADIVELVAGIFEQAASLAALRDLNTRFLCPMDRHICALCPDAIQRLMYHLLSNAFKFTPAGGLITVELSRSKGQILLSVADTGPGIPKERRLTLFRPCPSDTPAPQPFGPGLGLALSQRIARGHGGVLYLDPGVTQGSRFVLAMPDRTCSRPTLSDKHDYSSGFNRSLLGLADALPSRAFLIRNQ